MKKDKQIIIATHGKLAEGFKSALKIIVGDFNKLKTVNCYTTPEFDLDKTIEGILSNHSFDQEDLIICTDMMGGSVNNGFVKYLGQYPFHLITNTNLAFLVDLLLTPGGINKEMLTKKAKEELVSVKYINSMVENFHEADDL